MTDIQLNLGAEKMQNLTDAGNTLVNGLSNRYGLSRDAVIHMIVAVNNGGCSMAQFSCPELGGSGQWMQGGMTMVGDMFNYGLKSTVDNLCNEIAGALSNIQVFPVIPAGSPGSSQWWPSDCGNPISSGAQNSTRYAIFPGKLAVQVNSQVTVYDTLNHNIGGVSQQQGGDNSLTFSSQFGTISVNQLPKLPTSEFSGMASADVNTNFIQPVESQQSQYEPEVQLDRSGEQSGNQLSNQQGNQSSDHPSYGSYVQAGSNVGSAEPLSTVDTIELIRELAKLRDDGAITKEDFNNKKTELLARI